MKNKALSYEDGLSKGLKKYLRDQKKESRRPFKISSIDELLKSIRNSNVIYLGDFHTFDQNSKNLAKILQILVKDKYKVMIGVEFVHYNNQSYIDSFLDGYITELEFLESINYNESWKFPWNHYKTFFDLAKKHKLRLIALNSNGTLSERDNKAASILSEHISGKIKSKILVLFGELHILQDKLPRKLEKSLGYNICSTIIHQNLDEIYWKIRGRHDKDQIVKFKNNEFSLQTSPPWVKYESMIYWFQNLSEDPDFDIHEYLISTGKKIFNSNAHEYFYYLCSEIIKSLNIFIDQYELENFNIYDHVKLDNILIKLNQVGHKGISNFLKKIILKGRSFKVPLRNDYYCSSYSINRMSFLAGTHIISILRPNLEELLFSKKQSDKFLYYTYLSLFSYLSSKVINPYRKCDLYIDIVRRMNAHETSAKRKESLNLTISIMNNFSSFTELTVGKPVSCLQSAGKSIGNIIADSIYDNFYKKSSGKFLKIKKILLDDDINHISFVKLTNLVFSKVDFKSMKKRVF